MQSESDQRIRTLAIVLQSLDAGTARQLLSSIPAEVARDVRRTLSRLGNVPVEAQQAAFAQLESLLESLRAPATAQQGDRAPLAPSTASTATAARSSFPPDVASVVDPPSVATPWSSIPPERLAELLHQDRPLVIATVLHQLPLAVAAELIHLLPRDSAASALSLLPELRTTDPGILADIQEELLRLLSLSAPSMTHPDRGIERLRAILNRLPAQEQSAWNAAIAAYSPDWATNTEMQSLSEAHLASDAMGTSYPTFHSSDRSQHAFNSASAHSPLSTLPFQPVRSTRASDATAIARTLPATDRQPTDDDTGPDTVPFTLPATASPDRSLEELLELEDEDLVVAIQENDPQTVLVALVHASPRVLGRIERLLPAREIRRLRQRLEQLTGIAQADVVAARQTIVRQTEALVQAGRIRPFRTQLDRRSA
ncbi:MAG: FliG C-terminal domain-containing protein [Pirellula sp.]